MKKIIRTCVATTILVLFAFSASVLAENGVTSFSIKFGQTAAIGGPASALGSGMRDGIKAAFDEINNSGGVHGRKLDLLTLDDGYEPDKAIININKLIDKNKVFAIIGAVGTSTSKAIAPIACENNVPFIGPFTGAGFLRDMDCVVNIRGTYCQETETWVEHLTEDLGVKNIGLLYQDDSFGRVGKACVNKALEKRGMKLVVEGYYKRNTTAVKSAVVRIRKANPDAIVTVGAYEPIAAFIKTAHKIGFKVPILNISFTGSKALSKELGSDTDKVIVSQVVPFPFDTSIPIVADYQAALKASNSSLEPDFVSMEGYMVGKLAIRALNKAGKDVNRKSFLASFSGVHDLGGVSLTYDIPKDNQGMDDIFLTLIKPDGTFESLDSLKSLK